MKVDQLLQDEGFKVTPICEEEVLQAVSSADYDKSRLLVCEKKWVWQE